MCGAAPLARLTSLSQSARVRRIGFIIGGPPSLIDAFRDALRTFGYIDGRNFLLDLRVASGADIAKPAS